MGGVALARRAAVATLPLAGQPPGPSTNEQSVRPPRGPAASHCAHPSSERICSTRRSMPAARRRGRGPRYPALAVATALTLRAVFRLALRQTEVLDRMLDLGHPEYVRIA